MMQLVRSGRAARIVAVFFLLWTGVDLTIPSLCAIDQQSDSRSARTESISLAGAGSTQSIPSDAAEDCFCCCHHIVSAVAWAPIPEGAFTQRVTAYAVEQGRVFHTRLDHPPRLA